MRPTLLTLYLLAIFYCSAQDNSSIINVYFSKDKYSISKESSEKIADFLDSLRIMSIHKIRVIGHTDSDGTDIYNKELSKNRALAVKQKLINYKVDEGIIDMGFFGETQPIAENSSKKGQQVNRRVEIIAYFQPKVEPKEEIVKEEEPSCEGDTLIELANGSLIKINICDYHKNPDCVKIQEFTDASSLANNGVSTENEDGEVLISGGMLKFDICEGVTVIGYMPYRENCMGDGMSLWDVTENGRWRERDEPLELEEINGRRYYALPLSGVGFINIDKLPRISLNKIKFKSKDGIRLASVSLFCDCPMWGARQPYKNRWKKKVVLRTTCCSDPIVSVVAHDEEGNLLTITNRKLSELDPANFLGRCRSDLRNSWWFFKIWNKTMYRKYKLRMKDFDENVVDK
ncbi:MAG: hypothetical protein COA32_09380 [Fluviicola sp.]|nr:MAG: hypothetical protein COA32_09380 [Fluviicola sp.]